MADLESSSESEDSVSEDSSNPSGNLDSDDLRELSANSPRSFKSHSSKLSETSCRS